MWPASMKIVRLNNVLLLCSVCPNVRHDLNSFEVLKQCKSDFQVKIHEALLIKKHRPSFKQTIICSLGCTNFK